MVETEVFVRPDQTTWDSLEMWRRVFTKDIIDIQKPKREFAVLPTLTAAAFALTLEFSFPTAY